MIYEVETTHSSRFVTVPDDTIVRYDDNSGVLRFIVSEQTIALFTSIVSFIKCDKVVCMLSVEDSNDPDLGPGDKAA